MRGQYVRAIRHADIRSSGTAHVAYHIKHIDTHTPLIMYFQELIRYEDILPVKTVYTLIKRRYTYIFITEDQYDRKPC